MHTPTPWGIEDTGDNLWIGPLRKDGSGKIAVIVFHICMEGIPDEHKACDRANAAYIVSCVNACAGINPEAVPMMREALEWIASQTDLFFAECTQAEEIIVRVRAALAKLAPQPMTDDSACPKCGDTSLSLTDGKLECSWNPCNWRQP